MKNQFILTFLIACFGLSANAQWSTPVSLGSSLFYSLEGDNNNTVHMAYGDGTISYKRSINEGATWSAPVTLGSGTIYYDRPLTVDGLNVYVVYFRNFVSVSDWCCIRQMGNIYMRRSTDGGITWQPEIQLSSSQRGYRVSVHSEGSNVYLTWMDYRSGNSWDIYFRKSATGGATWQPEVNLVSGINSFGEERPDVLVAGNSVHLFWMSALDNLPSCPIPGTGYNLPNCSEVFYKRSLDGGNTWGNNVRLDTGNSYDGRPIATIVNSDTLIVCWEGDDGINELETYTKRSIDRGNTWQPVQRMRFNSGHASHPWISSMGSAVHLAWYDNRISTNKEIYYMSSYNGGTTWGAEELVSNGAGVSEAPVLGTTANYVHAIWYDDRGGSPAPWYSRRLVGTSCTVPSTPGSISRTGGIAKVCPGDIRTYSVPLVAGVTYNWSVPIGAVINSGQGTNSINVTYHGTFTANGTLSVTANNACGSSVPRTITITRNVPATPSVITGTNYGLCSATNKIYSVTNVTGLVYTWSIPATATLVSGQGTNSITVNFPSANFTVTISVYGSNACGAGTARNLTVRSIPATPTVINGPVTVCSNSSGNAYSISAIPSATSYTWTAPSGSIITGNGVTSSNNVLTTTATAVTVTYGTITTTSTLKVKGNNNCGSSANKTLTLIPCSPRIGFNADEAANGINTQLSIFPNPAQNNFTIELLDNNFDITITDIMGRKVFEQQNISPQTQVDSKDFINGIYFVNVTTAEQKVYNQILIINK
ncbi:MAG: T9SS type A sorting domain-containing protein [Bacteroidota bacterium]|nr:T9SS type A sorting domain-containing protein [Bacteroidota bacterium]